MSRSDEEGSTSEDDYGTSAVDFGGASGPLFSVTSFDHYFAQASKPSKTSTNVFSSLVTPLSSHEYAAGIASSLERPSLAMRPNATYSAVFARFAMQLEEDYNLLLYGAGSKRRILNAFAAYIHNVKPAHVIVVNPVAPGFGYEDILSAIERIPQVSSFPSTRRGVEGQMTRIANYLSPRNDPRALYLIIHNIDAPSLRSPKAISVLSWLLANGCIHVAASVDNIAFPLKLPTDTLSAKKSAGGSGRVGHPAWLWHDTTTLESYDFELSSVDRSSLAGASQTTSTSQTRAETGNAVTFLSPEAARHILLSITRKAKKLFALLGTTQLQNMDHADVTEKEPKGIGMEYSTLFSLARENFVATNDTALRALMSEFRDHGLMLPTVQAGGAGEGVWIPLRKKALTDLVADIEGDQI